MELPKLDIRFVDVLRMAFDMHCFRQKFAFRRAVVRQLSVSAGVDFADCGAFLGGQPLPRYTDVLFPGNYLLGVGTAEGLPTVGSLNDTTSKDIPGDGVGSGSPFHHIIKYHLSSHKHIFAGLNYLAIRDIYHDVRKLLRTDINRDVYDLGHQLCRAAQYGSGCAHALGGDRSS